MFAIPRALHIAGEGHGVIYVTFELRAALELPAQEYWLQSATQYDFEARIGLR